MNCIITVKGSVDEGRDIPRMGQSKCTKTGPVSDFIVHNQFLYQKVYEHVRDCDKCSTNEIIDRYVSSRSDYFSESTGLLKLAVKYDRIYDRMMHERDPRATRHGPYGRNAMLVLSRMPVYDNSETYLNKDPTKPDSCSDVNEIIPFFHSPKFRMVHVTDRIKSLIRNTININDGFEMELLKSTYLAFNMAIWRFNSSSWRLLPASFSRAGSFPQLKDGRNDYSWIVPRELEIFNDDFGLLYDAIVNDDHDVLNNYIDISPKFEEEFLGSVTSREPDHKYHNRLYSMYKPSVIELFKSRINSGKQLRVSTRRNVLGEKSNKINDLDLIDQIVIGLVNET